jgi:ABC-2 type transport system ATP-binding protein
MTNALLISDLHKSYGQAKVLAGIDLRVEQGRIFGLAGVNGAGKTSLIKCILDFCAAQSGKVEIFGVDARITQARASLAYLPERFVPPWFLDGRSFLRFVLALHGTPYDEAATRSVFERLDLDPAALVRPVRQFSKGMTQKLGLTACVLSGKRLMVLDEPMSGLDPRARVRLKGLLSDLRNEGRTIFFSTHALADIDEIGDEMAILDKGRIRFAGTPSGCRTQWEARTLEEAFLRCCDTCPA